MKPSKVHFNNTARIHDVKNTAHARIDHSQPLKPAKRQQVYYQTPPDPSLLESQNRQMRNALCEAVEENEFLRDRVIELEALLAEAQNRIESYDEGLVNYVNDQQRRRDDRDGREREEGPPGKPRSRSRSCSL